MTRGQLVNRASYKLGMTDDADGLSFLRDVANEGVVEVLLKTHAYMQIGEMTLTSGTSEYRLDANILAIDDGRGSTPSGIGPYELITLAQMIDYQAASPVGSGTRKLIAIEGDLMIVAPTPGSSEVLRFYYIPRPTSMTDDSHDPSVSTYGGIPSEYHRAIEYYMLWQGSEADQRVIGGGRSAIPAEVKRESDFDKECALVRKRLRRKAGRGIRGAVVGYPARYRTGRNDIYPERY